MKDHVAYLCKTLPAALLLTACTLIVACNAGNNDASDNNTGSDTLAGGVSQPARVTSGTQLAGSRWRLVKFQSMDDVVGEIRPEDPSAYTMHLKEDSTVAMRLNCNQGMGTWAAALSDGDTSGTFLFGPLATTRMFCPPPSMDDRIARDVQYVRSFLLKDGLLHLSLMADGGIYTWEPDTSSEIGCISPEDGGPRNWTVEDKSIDLYEKPSAASAVVASLEPGTLLDNLGCVQDGEHFWCDVQQLGGGPRGYVVRDDVIPAISPDGSVATGPDDSAQRAGQGDFDATGKVPCASSPGQPMSECDFAVARAGGGYATVVITKADGRTRMVYFRMGIPIGADVSQADSYGEFRATKEGDLHFVQVGDERYEIPDAVVLGG